MATIRDKAESAIQTGIQIAEVSGTAFAFGYANGRWGDNGELSCRSPGEAAALRSEERVAASVAPRSRWIAR